jgi:hypothetical protein
MNTKLFYLPIIVSLVCVFTVSVCAQADCVYSINVDVRSTDGRFVDKADVSVYNRAKSADVYKPSRYANDIYSIKIVTDCGIEYKSFHLKVAAPGFVSREQTVLYDENKKPIVVTLLTTAEAASRKILLTGTIFDSNGALIPSATVTAKAQDGKEYTVITNGDGEYELLLSLGKYRIQATGFGCCIRVIEDYQIVNADKNKMSLDLVLTVSGTEDCPAPAKITVTRSTT